MTGRPFPRSGDPALHYRRKFGWMLRVTRAALNISEADAADTFCVMLVTYRRWETGERKSRPKHRAVIKFVKKYDLTYDWVLAADPAGLRFTPPPLPAEFAECAEVAEWEPKPPKPRRRSPWLRPKKSESGVIDFAAWKARRDEARS
jgi:transcriptional regulator with XRE-family HTH domain